MAAEKKKTGKNRRDSHGVYERRESRGKGYADRKQEERSGAGRSAQKGRPAGSDGGQRRGQAGNRQAARPAERIARTGGAYRAEAGKGGKDFSQQREADRGEFLFGRNPVIEALRAGREIEKIYLAEGSVGSASVIRGLAKEQGVVIDVVPKVRLDLMVPGEKHQGVAAEIPAYHYSEMADIFARAEASGEPPLLVLLDEINDPHNLGAIIRTAECVGAHGVVIPKRRACGLTSTAAKSSAGAVENMPVVRVTNLSRTIEELQEQGIWVAACDMDGDVYYDAPLDGAVAIVFGNEGRGISRNVREKCDLVCSIPMKGRINSLNASNAAAIVLYEIRRRREGARA